MIRFYAFDLLIYRGRSLLGLELAKRRELLAQVVASLGESIQMSESFEADSAELPRIAKQLGFEGVVAKRKHSLYEPGKRSGAWVKYRINKGQELVIGGYTAPQGSRTDFGALLVGYWEDGRLSYAGKVGTGFDHALLHELGGRLRELERDDPPFADVRPVPRGTHWVEPKLVAQIGFTEWTRDGRLRHPRFLGLRDDKAARDVVRERPA